MKKSDLLTRSNAIVLVAAIILLTQIVTATPNSMNIQGKLTNPSGGFITGTYNFTFRIYDSYTSGTLLYETNVTASTDARGVYDIVLANINLPFNSQYYLAVKINNDSEMQPRVNLTSVPYSFKANESLGLNASKDSTVNNNINLSSSGNIQAAGTITGNTLQATVQLDVGGGFNAGGLTIQQSGNIVTTGDVLFSGNITVINVTHLSVNGSLLPSLNKTFDLGNGSLMWRNLNLSGSLELLGDLTIDLSTLFVDSANNRVGIGTTSPATVLDVKGKANFTGNFSVGETSNILFVDNTSGNVGIGTTSPNDALEVGGNVRVSGSLNASSINTTGSAYFATSSGNVGINTTTPSSALTVQGGLNVSSNFYVNPNGDTDLKPGGTSANSVILRDDLGTIYFKLNRNNGYLLSTNIQFTPGDTYDIGSSINSNDPKAIYLRRFLAIGGSSGANQLIQLNGTGSTAVSWFNGGNVGIGTTAPTSTLHVIGTGNFSGSLYAGSCTNQTSPLNQTCTDIAELFPVETNVKEGDVVCLKENDKAGHCDNAYDSKILGIISTNPAIIIEGSNIVLGSGSYSNNGKMPIALKGKVPVKVICNSGIKKGDLLVSASKKGYAMKLDLDNATWKQATGTILGKALEECENEEKLIMAWIG